MSKKNGSSTKLTQEALNFLFDFETNFRLEIKNKGRLRKRITYSDTIELIAKYFKLNNDKYLELIKFGEKSL